MSCSVLASGSAAQSLPRASCWFHGELMLLQDQELYSFSILQRPWRTKKLNDVFFSASVYNGRERILEGLKQSMIEVDKAIDLIQRNFPQVAIQTVHPITRGWDSFVLEINDELIFRIMAARGVLPPIWAFLGTALWSLQRQREVHYARDRRLRAMFHM